MFNNYLTPSQREERVAQYIAEKTARGLPFDTLELDYLRKDLNQRIYDENGNIDPTYNE